MLRLRLHCNFHDQRPTLEYAVDPEIVAHALAELVFEVQEGFALRLVEIEGPNGSYRFKRRY